MQTETVTLTEAARLLQVNAEALRRRVKAGAFPVPRLPGVGRRVLFSRSLFMDFLQGRTIYPTRVRRQNGHGSHSARHL